MSPSQEVAKSRFKRRESVFRLPIGFQAPSFSRSTLLYPAIITLWISTSLTFCIGHPTWSRSSLLILLVPGNKQKWESSTTHGDGGTTGAWNAQQWLGKERRKTWNCESPPPPPHTYIMPPEEENILHYTDLLFLGNILSHSALNLKIWHDDVTFKFCSAVPNFLLFLHCVVGI